LEHFSIGARKGKKARGRRDQARQRRIKQLQQDSFGDINLHVYFPCYIWHAWDCMCFFSIMAWVFLGMTIFLAYPFHFLIAFMRWVLSCILWGMSGLDSKLSVVDLRIDKHMVAEVPKPK